MYYLMPGAACLQGCHVRPPEVSTHYGGFMSTPEQSLRSRLFGKRAAQAAVLVTLFAGAVGMAAGPATAQGKSNELFNCYTQWWNTAWAQECPQGATWSGVYTSGVACSLQSGKRMSVVRPQGSSTTHSGEDCMYRASQGWINYNPY
jgi:hypothetical protein